MSRIATALAAYTLVVGVLAAGAPARAVAPQRGYFSFPDSGTDPADRPDPPFKAVLHFGRLGGSEPGH